MTTLINRIRPIFLSSGSGVPTGFFIGVVALMVIVAIFAPWIAPYDPNAQNLLGRLKAPGTEARNVLYVLGSDELGRDLLSRLIYGARISLSVAFLSVILSGCVGILLGMLAGYRRGWVETVIMRLVDIFLSVPAILLAIITVAVLGPGFVNVILVLALTRWPRYARVAYGQTLSVAGQPYVRLARAMGASWGRILLLHILPNIIAPLSVVATLEFGLMVLFEAGLSFLGLGVQPPTASWGAMLSVGRNYVSNAWWIATFPGLCLFMLVLSVNLIGDRLSEYLNPKSR
ncbi:ABC transporter permease [Nitratireductor basaltis]|uniref:Binding-protein-dependent transport systems inner membrane component n=1 Tax=Nitratireductor basaltis TaxID=472175 RepID=A0A084U569_9HYPH|nr:ABC transporter permease [Nitratireductor basaltis]KFB08105.1 Binding-protein-dependent transport systems inner membrane component precursor [Nitratireductor basaltis]